MRFAHLLSERREGKTKAINNSTYRLRYAPKGARQQRSQATMRSVHLLPERREGKTKVIKQQHLRLAVLKRIEGAICVHNSEVATTPTTCGMRRRV